MALRLSPPSRCAGKRPPASGTAKKARLAYATSKAEAPKLRRVPIQSGDRKLSDRVAVPNTDPILDPTWAISTVAQNYGSAIEALNELVRFAVELLKRTLSSPPDDLAHHMVLSVLFRQAIQAADAACELVRVGAADAAHVQLRALMEARWGLMLALSNPKKWGTPIYVASRREQLSQLKKGIEGTPEYIRDTESRDLAEKYGRTSAPPKEKSTEWCEGINAILAKPEYRDVSNGFDAFAKDKKFEPPWYYDPTMPKEDRIVSVRKLADAVGAIGEYKSMYHHASQFIHGGYTGTHLTTDDLGVSVTPLRTPATVRTVLLLCFSLIADCTVRVIRHWRPDEEKNFAGKYVETWREIIFKMPEVELILERAVNRE